MRHARRCIAIIVGCATWCIAAATVAGASMLHDPVPVRPVVATLPVSGTSAWQLLATAALGALLVLAVARVVFSLRHARSRHESLQPPLHA